MIQRLLQILFIAVTLPTLGQINMGNLGTVSNGCGQTFYDSGGQGSDYSSSENYSATFCAPAGQYITFNFTSFGLGSGDALKIYNGSNTSAQLIGSYSSNPGQITSTLGGCLTFVFTSDASIANPIPFLPPITSNGSGWAASIICGATPPPPPPPTPGTCAAASPFCTSTGATYAAATGTSSESGPNYGCLSSQPSPGWFYLNIATSGNIQINLSNSADQDIDFAIWGPFSSQAALCGGTTNAPIDCSYDPASTEQVDIPNAVAGQWYIMVITNFADSPTNITATAGNAAGTDGTTNCAILCNMTALTATPTACNTSTNQYTLNGQITVQYPPTSGTLTITSTCGTSVTVPTPWNSPISYSMPNLTSNGASCSVTASFSADPTCTLTQTYTAPASCTSTPSCSITSVTATPTACTPATNTYSLSGQINFSNPPTTGTLTISGSCGGSQTFNAPFTSPQSYSFTNLSPTGGSCNVTATFSANSGCTNSQSYTAPASCTSSSCYISYLDANIGACEPNSTFTVDGTFTYESSPSSGSVIVTVTNNSGSYTQTFPTPFTNSVSNTYSISGIQSDGSPLTVTVAFSADPSCSMDITGQSPAACGCVAQIGTFTATITGASTNNYVLCYGDQISITSNNDFTAPEEATNPPGPTYDPGVSWLIYSCPPTIAVVPDSTQNVPDDPCILGLASDFDFTDINDQSLLNFFPAGTFTNNTVYFVPITMYSITDGVYSYVNTSMPCYDLGTPFAVQYLPQIDTTVTETCATGTVSVQISGGLPSLNSSQFHGVIGSITPNTASFGTASCANNGTITVTGLQNGQNYSFDIEDDNGCPVTVSGVFNGASPINAGPDQSVCIGTSVTLTATGDPGTTFTWNNGVQNGVAFTPSNTATYTVTGTNSAGCTSTDQVLVSVNLPPTVSAGVDVTICEGDSVLLTGSGASNYQWSGGISDGVYFSPANGTSTYTVTGISGAGCSATDQVSVTVNPIPVIDFTPNITSGCAPLVVTFTNNTQSAGNCVWTLGDGTTLNGCGTIQNTYEQAGCYSVSLTASSGNCSATLVQTDLICVDANPVADFSMSSFAVTELYPDVQFNNGSINAVSYYWNFDDGTTSNQTNPMHVFPIDNGEEYNVVLIAYSQAGCTDTATQTIIIKEDLIFYVPNCFTPDNDNFNQTFQPIFTSGFDPFDYSLYIFDRWGELIFESHDTNIGWDGTYGGQFVQDGVYTWKIIYQILGSDEREIAVGHVSILR